MNDLHVAHRTLKSASKSFATAENAIGRLRGMQYKVSNKHWSFNPKAAKNSVPAHGVKKLGGKFIGANKLAELVAAQCVVK